MRQCCRCNGSGRCKNCSCVKAQKACVDCLPSKRSRCSNLPGLPPAPLSASKVDPSSCGDLPADPPADPPAEDDLVAAMASSPVMPEIMPTTGHLPDFKPMAAPIFTWGAIDSAKFTGLLDTTFHETAHWRRNCFRVPQGSAGKAFTNELARLFRAFAAGSALESVYLKAVTVLPSLLLQKPHQKSKQQDHIACLDRRMRLWEDGDISELLSEGRTIQSRLPKHRSHQDEAQLSRSFDVPRKDPRCPAAVVRQGEGKCPVFGRYHLTQGFCTLYCQGCPQEQTPPWPARFCGCDYQRSAP